MQHMTSDKWHVTRDMLQVTRDMWHVGGGEHSLKISAIALMVCDLWYLKICRKIQDDSMNDWTNEWCL